MQDYQNINIFSKGYFSNWKSSKKRSINKSIFPKPKSLGANVKVELELYNYATKGDLKNATRVDAPDFAKIDLD